MTTTLSPYALQLLERHEAKEIFRPLIDASKQTWDMGFDAFERGIPLRMLKREAAKQGWHARAKVDELAAAGIEMRDPTVWDEILDKLMWIVKEQSK